jgi:hypothetical protein
MSGMLDAHYTPPEIARQMLDALPLTFLPKSVADFACGDGALLIQAEMRWNNSRIIANDIDVNLTKRLRRQYTSWEISAIDFLRESSLRRSKLSTLERGGVDCVLINPPFSERSKSRITSVFFDRRIVSGPTMNFLLRALRFLAPRGYMVAVLPDSCFISQRDRIAWDAINAHFVVQKVRRNSRNTFKGIAALTTVAIFHHRDQPQTVPNSNRIPRANAEQIKLVRGKVQMHSADRWEDVTGYPLIHTSDLVANRVKLTGTRRVTFRHVVKGPAVLLPRVGAVTPGKIAVLDEDVSIVLSDCVLAIACRSSDQARTIFSAIVSQWDLFRNAYGGTGAPYTTLDRISEWLTECLAKLEFAPTNEHTTLLTSVL